MDYPKYYLINIAKLKEDKNAYLFVFDIVVNVIINMKYIIIIGMF